MTKAEQRIVYNRAGGRTDSFRSKSEQLFENGIKGVLVKLVSGDLYQIEDADSLPYEQIKEVIF